MTLAPKSIFFNLEIVKYTHQKFLLLWANPISFVYFRPIRDSMKIIFYNFDLT